MDEDGHKENDLIVHRNLALMGQDCFFWQGLVVSMWLFLTCIHVVANTFVVFLSHLHIANGMEHRAQE